MALIIVRRDEPQTLPEKHGFSWDQWYAQNKERLAEKRAKRYAEDSAYREAALKRSREQRKKTKLPVEDEYTVSFTEMARLLSITVWVLREWRRKSYFPEPYHRDGRLWFKPEHEGLLISLREYFDTNGVRVTDATRKGLEDVVSLVYSNW